MRILLFSLLALFLLTPASTFAKDEEAKTEEEEMSYPDRIIEHISDANEFHLWGHTSIPLPCILYSFDDGLKMFWSNKFDHGHNAVHGYVMHHGDVMRIKDYTEDMHVEHIDEIKDKEVETAEGETVSKYYAVSHGEEYELEKPSTLVKFTSWIDFSITKVVFTLLVAAILMVLIFLAVAKGYRKREGQAPKGIQSLIEPLFVFMRDEVVEPAIGSRYERYMPFIMSLFFFILITNFLGLIPFFPGSGNATGNLGVTLALALVTMIVVNFSGNKHYWQHIFWMPGVPVFVKLMLAPIEIAGIFIKPFTLLIRLFANMTAGHIIILSMVGMVFILGDNGESLSGATVGGVMATLFVFALNLLELLVAFIQAFLFALLSALYIGMAVEEHHEEH